MIPEAFRATNLTAGYGAGRFMPCQPSATSPGQPTSTKRDDWHDAPIDSSGGHFQSERIPRHSRMITYSNRCVTIERLVARDLARRNVHSVHTFLATSGERGRALGQQPSPFQTSRSSTHQSQQAPNHDEIRARCSDIDRRGQRCGWKAGQHLRVRLLHHRIAEGQQCDEPANSRHPPGQHRGHWQHDTERCRREGARHSGSRTQVQWHECQPATLFRRIAGIDQQGRIRGCLGELPG